MSIKDYLLQEAANITLGVELDTIFESVELSPEVKEQFSMVFEQSVKAKAVELAESHIQDLADQAEMMVEEQVEEQMTELAEKVNQYFEHLTEEWMTENKLAVENGIKVQMFDSLVGTLKEAFVEHNIELPEESINVVAEMEDELAETQAELDKLLVKNHQLQESINNYNRDRMIEEATAYLSENQRDKVTTLAEGLSFNDQFSERLATIVEMVSARPAQAAPTQQIAENANPNYQDEFDFVDENEFASVEENEPAKQTVPSVLKYL